MNEKTRLILALQQINNITSLLQDNKYKNYLYSNLITIEVELQLHLTNLTYNEIRRFKNSSQQHVDATEQQRSQLSDLTSTN